MSPDGWVGVDLDGVLAYWDVAHFPEIGEPIAPMVARVKDWLALGVDVRIFTARVAVVSDLRNDEGVEANLEFAADQQGKIQRWCQEYLGQVLPVTAVKDFRMVRLYDDRCVQMLTNRGVALQDEMRDSLNFIIALINGCHSD